MERRWIFTLLIFWYFSLLSKWDRFWVNLRKFEEILEKVGEILENLWEYFWNVSKIVLIIWKKCWIAFVYSKFSRIILKNFMNVPGKFYFRKLWRNVRNFTKIKRRVWENISVHSQKIKLYFHIKWKCSNLVKFCKNYAYLFFDRSLEKIWKKVTFKNFFEYSSKFFF